MSLEYVSEITRQSECSHASSKKKKKTLSRHPLPKVRVASPSTHVLLRPDDSGEDVESPTESPHECLPERYEPNEGTTCSEQCRQAAKDENATNAREGSARAPICSSTTTHATTKRVEIATRTASDEIDCFSWLVSRCEAVECRVAPSFPPDALELCKAVITALSVVSSTKSVQHSHHGDGNQENDIARGIVNTKLISRVEGVHEILAVLVGPVHFMHTVDAS
eukprot:m.64163 g.64163  ORF g.64163 m.64163 type:complete len:223 (-) comp7503_c0_seq2:105-773(-)